MLAPLRVAPLLLLVALGTGAAEEAASAKRPRDVATYFLPEDERHEHGLVLQQLDALGIERFTPPAKADENDVLYPWSALPKSHEQIDLVWSTNAAPPLDKLRFAKTFRAKVNHVPGSQQRLSNADAFVKHIRKNQRKKEKFFFNFVPRYLVLPRDNEKMPKVFEETLKRVQYEMKREDDWYIYQRFLVRELPGTGNDGALSPAAIVVNDQELQEKLRFDFKDQTVEVSQYVEPYLIDGHKFQVGFYVAITSIDPLRIYYYGHPQIKIAKVPYPASMDVNADHAAYNFNEYIPPWDFLDLQKLYYEFPSANRPGTNSWGVLKRYLMLRGLDTTHLQKQINDAIVTSIISSRGYFQAEIAKLKRFTPTGEAEAERTDLDESFFELLRFDFELDDMGKPWLTRVHSNPSMAPQKSAVATDEAIKKNLLFDLFNLVGVHPQAKPSFDQFFVPTEAKFCTEKCSNRGRVWDTSCWSCPGWFAPYVARRLFDSMNEYARRGAFQLIYPSLDSDYSQFMDNELSQHDHAFNRYIKSLSWALSEKQDVPVFNRVVTCIYREHCNGNGDCVNGKCVCDDLYEGTTCYIPKNMEREKRLKVERAAAAARATESWKDRVGNLWNRAPEPAHAAAAKDRVVPNGGDGAMSPEDPHVVKAHAAPSELERFSAGGLVFALLLVGLVLYGGYQFFLSRGGSSDLHKNN